MKIAIFSDAFHPQINGVVTSILSLARNMADRGHEVIIIAPYYRDLEEYSYPGIKIKRVVSLSASFYDDFRWTPPSSYSTYKFLKDEKVDIVHFMTPIFISLLGIKYARKLNIPLVGTFHTFIADPAYFRQLFNGPIKVTEEITWEYLNLYYNSADYVTAPTEAAVEIIREKGCHAPIEAVSNGIDLQSFDNSRSGDFRKKYNLGKEVILYIGRLAQEKNLTTLIDAFGLVHRARPESQLLIIGDGPQRKELTAYSQSKPWGDRIIFTGAISNRELCTSGVFGAASLFATVSATETQGITILEAQANGLIAVGARAGGILDLIEDGVNGFLVSPYDTDEIAGKILHVLDNPGNLEEMRENALRMIESHKIHRVIDRWEELYSDLIRRKKEGLLPGRPSLRFRTILNFARSFKLDIGYFRKKPVPEN